jgi:hypothetical protein
MYRGEGYVTSIDMGKPWTARSIGDSDTSLEDEH